MGWVGGSCVHQSGPTNQFGQPRWVAKWANPGGWPSGPTQANICDLRAALNQCSTGPRPAGWSRNKQFFIFSVLLLIYKLILDKTELEEPL